MLQVALSSRTAITALASVTDSSGHTMEACLGLCALIRYKLEEDARNESEDDEFASASTTSINDRALCEALYTLCVGTVIFF